MKTLTPKQIEFVRLYCNDPKYKGNATQCYIKAGYKDGTGTMQAACRLLSTVKVKQAIAQEVSNRTAQAQVKAEYIREQWLQLLNDCKEGDKYTDRTNANSVLRTMAQSCAMLTDNIHQTEQTPEQYTEDQVKEMQKRIKIYNETG